MFSPTFPWPALKRYHDTAVVTLCRWDALRSNCPTSFVVCSHSYKSRCVLVHLFLLYSSLSTKPGHTNGVLQTAIGMLFLSFLPPLLGHDRERHLNPRDRDDILPNRHSVPICKHRQSSTPSQPRLRPLFPFSRFRHLLNGTSASGHTPGSRTVTLPRPSSRSFGKRVHLGLHPSHPSAFHPYVFNSRPFWRHPSRPTGPSAVYVCACAVATQPLIFVLCMCRVKRKEWTGQCQRSWDAPHSLTLPPVSGPSPSRPTAPHPAWFVRLQGPLPATMGGRDDTKAQLLFHSPPSSPPQLHRSL